MADKQMRKIIIAGMLGNGLEWYDYALYAYMTLIISKLFFPAGHADAHLLATLGIFAVGFVARPFGGVLFGWIGDKFGRRVALVSSIFMMAVPTGCIGLLPTYAQVGVAAPILLTVIRILQGLSLGGAFCGAMTFLVEHAPANRRGIIGSASIASICIGFLLGSLVAMLVRAPLSEAQYESWGWRVPFLLGIIIGFVGLYIREHCEESPVYAAARREGALSDRPVRDALVHEWKHMAQAVGIYMAVTMPFYMVSAFFITFTEHTLMRPPEEALMLNTLNMVILLVTAPLSAWLSDRIGRKKLLIVGVLGFFILSTPLFALMQLPGFLPILLAQAAFAALVGLYTGPVPTILVEIFPTRVRYTGMALSYNVSAALFGGTAPMACQWLLDKTGNNYSIAAYVMLCALLSLVALIFYRDRYREALA